MTTATFSPTEPDHSLEQLENGVLVATFPMPWLHEVGITIFVRAGSRFEPPHLAGIAHFLEHMLFKGTRTIPDPSRFHAHLEGMAADMNAATGQESSLFWITLPPRFLAAGFGSFCEMFTAPALSGIEIERQVILSEMRDDENDLGEIINSGVLGGARLWAGHPLEWSVIGSAESVSRIGVSDLREFLQIHYCGANLAVGFYGAVEHAQAVELVRTHLGRLPRGERIPVVVPPPLSPGPHWVAANDQASQFGLSLFYRTGGFAAAELQQLAALRRLLDDGFSSRLQSRLRERHGLVYDIGAMLFNLSDTGFMEVSCTVSPENLLEVYRAINSELSELTTAAPPESEWQRTITRWLAAISTTLDNPQELLERYLGDRLWDHLESLSQVHARIVALDPATLPAVATRLFSAENLVVVLVGPNAARVITELQPNPKIAAAPPPPRLPWLRRGRRG